MKHFPFAIALSLTLLAACTPSVPNNAETAASSSSSSLVVVASSSARSLSAEEETAAWLKYWDIDVHVGDPLYGLMVASIDPPNIRVKGDVAIPGTLEWRIHFSLPTLFFLPDAEVPELLTRAFIVEDENLLPVRYGAKVRATVDLMNILLSESSRPSTVTFRDVDIVGARYESIPEASAEWQYYLQLKEQAKTDPSITL